MSNPIRIGIIGAGNIFRGRHFPGLANIADAQVVAICNRGEESARAIASEFGLKPDIMTDPHALMARPDIDAVMIGTWPYKHCPYVLESLDRGKHTFVQARMAMNLREAKAMYAKARETGLAAQICPSPFGLNGHNVMRRLIDSGYLGEIRNVHARFLGNDAADPATPLHWRQIAMYSGLNALVMGIVVETVQRWYGCMKTVSAQAKTFTKTRPIAGPQSAGPQSSMGAVERPDTIYVTGEMENGAAAAFLFSAVAHHGVDPQIEAYGSKGTLIYNLKTDTILGAQAGDGGLSEIPIPAEEVKEWTVEQDFINLIKTGVPAWTSFSEGVKYMEFTEAVFRSVERAAVVNLPLVD
ncbi:MAG: Gfo/Idh/MocA family oxidoreductase [Acidobacteria bacterium]|nr:Gfo/Idh/MocA family oxidoreductase [Acidobacteriota bacterium]